MNTGQLIHLISFSSTVLRFDLTSSTSGELKWLQEGVLELDRTHVIIQVKKWQHKSNSFLEPNSITILFELWGWHVIVAWRTTLDTWLHIILRWHPLSLFHLFYRISRMHILEHLNRIDGNPADHQTTIMAKGCFLFR